jgi:hypothetical protein
MGFLDLFKPRKPAPAVRLPSFNIDLGTFSCGNTKIGNRPDPRDPFTPYFQTQEVVEDSISGIELGIRDGVLDYAYLDLARCTFPFFRSGTALPLSARTTIADIHASFGEPYWTDDDEDEIILFYEYQRGELELQFEFPGKQRLGVITIMANGILSEAEQRAAYRVTKPWPP